MIKLVVADCDGTILDPKKELDTNMIEVVEKLRKKGIEFTLASGRNRFLLQDISKELNVTLPYIANNGANLYQNDEMVEVYALEIGQLNEIVQLLVENNSPFLIYGEKETHRHKRHPLLDVFVDKLIGKAEIIEYEIGKELTNIEVFKVTVACDDASELKSVQERINKEYPEVVFNRSEGNLFTITSRHATKGQALERLLIHEGYTKEEVLVMGDNYNDVSMFKVAKVSVAMYDSLDEIKKQATHIAGSNKENGASAFIKQYFNLD